MAHSIGDKAVALERWFEKACGGWLTQSRNNQREKFLERNTINYFNPKWFVHSLTGIAITSSHRQQWPQKKLHTTSDIMFFWQGFYDLSHGVFCFAVTNRIANHSLIEHFQQPIRNFNFKLFRGLSENKIDYNMGRSMKNSARKCCHKLVAFLSVANCAFGKMCFMLRLLLPQAWIQIDLKSLTSSYFGR